MKRRTMLLVVVVLSLSIVFNVLLPKTGVSATEVSVTGVSVPPGISPVVCTGIWCCVFDWGCLLNPFVPDGQWKCCQPGCINCVEIDGEPCCP